MYLYIYISVYLYIYISIYVYIFIHLYIYIPIPGVQLKVTLARASFKSAPHSPLTPTSAIRADWLAGDSRSAAEWTEDGSQSKRACGVRRSQAAAGGAVCLKGGGVGKMLRGMNERLCDVGQG